MTIKLFLKNYFGTEKCFTQDICFWNESIDFIVVSPRDFDLDKYYYEKKLKLF